MPFAGEPALIAIRQVQTPDRSFTQGFVVDREALTAWLATKAGDMIPVLRPDHSAGAPVAPQWGLTLEPNPQSLTGAAADSRAIASSFVMRFAGVGAVSVIAAALVFMLVARAETLAHERSQFAAAAAHELRTPLAGLQLYGDMLADGLGDPGKMREYSRRMSDDAARLGRVVSNILGFSQLERGNLAVEPQAGPAGEVLCELAERARPSLEQLGAALEVDVSARHARTVRSRRPGADCQQSARQRGEVCPPGGRSDDPARGGRPRRRRRGQRVRSRSWHSGQLEALPRVFARHER